MNLECIVAFIWRGVKAQAQSINYLGVLLTVGLFFVGQWLIKRAERKTIERDKQIHKDQEKKIWEKQKKELVPLLVREVMKALESKGYSKEQTESPVVQDAIHMSATTIINTWKGPIVGSTAWCDEPGHIIEDIFPGITKEDDKQKEEDKKE